MSKKRRYRRDATERYEPNTCSCHEIQQPNDSPRHISSRNWENSKGWGELERTGTTIKTNINIVLTSTSLDTFSRKFICGTAKTGATSRALHTRVSVVFMLLRTTNFQLQGLPRLTLFETWNDISLYWAVNLLF